MFMQIETERGGKTDLLLINLHHVVAIFRGKDHPEMKIKSNRNQEGYGSQFMSFKVVDYTYSELVAIFDTIKMPLHDKIENFEVDDRSCIKG